MVNKKIVISLIIFSALMILTSSIKTQTRIIEKNINIKNKKIAFLKDNLHESELEFFYLSSPEYLSSIISKFSSKNYLSMNFSQIYLSLEDFLTEQSKITKELNYESKTKKN
ncbi:hypothetical protein OAS47_01275 [Pelagibacteraceae bacterium]|nr:hypothetical protein [Pelagibacteraceae bacterium]